MATDRPGSRQTSDLSVDGATYISWAVINNSPNSIGYPFFVDVYMDDLFIERWESNGLDANRFISLTDWDGMTTRIRLRPGTHRLKLLADSTNLIPETDESDNVYEMEFTWSASTNEPPAPTPVPTKLPDLVPSTPELWGDSLVATSYVGDKVDGPLSVNVPTYIRYGFQNRGLASIAGDIWVYLYVDDVLVTAQVGSGLLAEETAGSSLWAGLFDVISITPGVHTLRLEVDATDLVMESDETNNTMEKSFVWGTGPVPPRPAPTPTPEATAPSPLTLPNLVPGWSSGWDGPIIASQEEGTFLDNPLSVDGTPFIDIVVHNQSIVEASAPFSVDLYLDGEVIHTFPFSEGVKPNQLRLFKDWSGLFEQAPVAEGPHTLTMVIDPDDSVEEANEGDNVFEKTFVWVTGTAQPPAPITYTDQDLRRMLADLQTMIETREPVLSDGGKDHTREVLEVADAVYYLLTGTSLWHERVDIYLLTDGDYLDWIDSHYGERMALSEGTEYADLLAERERTKLTAAGLTVSRFGKTAVVVNAGRNLADVMGTLAHELGHMRQGFLNPTQNDGDYASHYRKAIQEAQAQQFERAFWLRLEKFTGLSLLEYQNYQGFLDLIDQQLGQWYEKATQDEHSLGYLLQWLAVLDDPALAELRQMLTNEGQLSATSALELYDYLVALTAESIQAYVAARLQALDAYVEPIRAIAQSRLVSDLHPDGEGSPDLRVVGLLVP